MADAATTTFDIAPLIREVVLPMATALGMALATWLSAKLAALLNVKRDDVLAGKLERALQNGLAYAQGQAADRLGTGAIPIDVKNALVAQAAAYATGHVPDALKTLGITPDALAEKLRARLELNTTPPEQSIALPTPPSQPPKDPT